MFMPIKNLKSITCEDCGDTLLVSADMIEKGFYFKLTYRKASENQVHLYDEIIEVNHFKSDMTGGLLQVDTYMLRWDKPLSPIETYRLIKDLQELYWLYTVDSNKPFLDLLEEMSVHYMTTTEEEEFMEHFEHDLDLISQEKWGVK